MAINPENLSAPFPYFGGKRLVADVVWRALGDCPNYIEPFFGSGAVLLARPDWHRWWERTETVNDKDGMVSNFWRAVQADADAVAHWADWPVNENDLHARHAWLVERMADLQARLEGDPDYYDAKIAGWWVWGICIWIAGGWCRGQGPWHVVDGRLVRIADDTEQGIKRQLVHLGNAGKGIQRNLFHLADAGKGIQRGIAHLSDAGQGINRKKLHLTSAGQGINRKMDQMSDTGEGINRKLVHLGCPGKGINRQRIHLTGAGQGINRQPVQMSDTGEGHCAVWSEHLRTMMQRLQDRLRRVRVSCGDWSRICGPSPTIHNGLTAVFLDPPYSHDERDRNIYRVEMSTADSVRAWAIEHGDDPRYRIALCGYEGEHEMPENWTVYRWKAPGGYANRGSSRARENRFRETVWFSPHCLPLDGGVQQMSLFPEDEIDL